MYFHFPYINSIFGLLMKKIWVPIVMICYLAASSGVIVNYHYCMKKLVSHEFFASEGKKCVRCGMGMHKSKGCCRDEVQLVKMADDQKITAAISFELPHLDALVVAPSAFIATSFYNVSSQGHFHNHSPPLLTEQDTYLKNNVFRI
jgi:hypothetical protein